MSAPVQLALLRGINVGGHRTVRMADLKRCFVEDMAFAEARTHINSGNVLFRAGECRADLEQRIAAQLELTFGFVVEIFVRSGEELRAIVESGPFAGSTDSAEITRYVTFLKTPLDARQAALVATIDNPGEVHTLRGMELHSMLDRSVSANLVFSGNFLDKQLKCVSTTRNWKVVRKLAELAGEIEG